MEIIISSKSARICQSLEKPNLFLKNQIGITVNINFWNNSNSAHFSEINLTIDLEKRHCR